MQRLGVLDQDAVLCADARAGHDRGRRGQTQRARAGDKQHRRHEDQRGAQWILVVVEGSRTPKVPEEADEHSQRHHGGHEDRRDLVRQILDRRAAGLRVLHHLDDLRQRGLLAHRRCLEAEAARLVDGAADDRVARRLGHRQALAGEHGLVDGALPRRHHAVDRDLLARPHDDDVAHQHILDGHLDLFGRRTAAAHDACRLGAQPQQLADRLTRLPLATRFEEFSDRNQRQNHSRRLEVDVIVHGVQPQHEHGQAVEIGHARPHGHQRVHVGGAILECLPCADVVVGAQVDLDDSGQTGDQPQPPRKVERDAHHLGHAQDHDDRAEHGADDDLALLVGDLGVAGGLFGIHLRLLARSLDLDDLVAGVAHRALDVGHLHHGGQVGHARALAGVARVDIQHAVDALERARDGVGAVVARHAGDRQIDLRQRRAIAQILDYCDHLIGRDALGVIVDDGALAGVRDTRLVDAGHALQVAPHRVGTVGAMHADDGDDQLLCLPLRGRRDCRCGHVHSSQTWRLEIGDQSLSTGNLQSPISNLHSNLCGRIANLFQHLLYFRQDAVILDLDRDQFGVEFGLDRVQAVDQLEFTLDGGGAVTA